MLCYIAVPIVYYVAQGPGRRPAGAEALLHVRDPRRPQTGPGQREDHQLY